MSKKAAGVVFGFGTVLFALFCAGLGTNYWYQWQSVHFGLWTRSSGVFWYASMWAVRIFSVLSALLTLGAWFSTIGWLARNDIKRKIKDCRSAQSLYISSGVFSLIAVAIFGGQARWFGYPWLGASSLGYSFWLAAVGGPGQLLLGAISSCATKAWIKAYTTVTGTIVTTYTGPVVIDGNTYNSTADGPGIVTTVEAPPPVSGNLYPPQVSYPPQEQPPPYYATNGPVYTPPSSNGPVYTTPSSNGPIYATSGLLNSQPSTAAQPKQDTNPTAAGPGYINPASAPPAPGNLPFNGSNYPPNISPYPLTGPQGVDEYPHGSPYPPNTGYPSPPSPYPPNTAQPAPSTPFPQNIVQPAQTSPYPQHSVQPAQTSPFPPNTGHPSQPSPFPQNTGNTQLPSPYPPNTSQPAPRAASR